VNDYFGKIKKTIKMRGTLWEHSLGRKMENAFTQLQHSYSAAGGGSGDEPGEFSQSLVRRLGPWVLRTTGFEGDS